MTVELYCGDCLDVLAQLDSESIDAVITDPPYGIDFDRATWEDSPETYADFMRIVISESNRLATGIKAFWQALPNAPIWHKWFPSDFRIFAACKGFVQFRPTPIQWSWDPIIWWGNIDKQPSVYAKDWFVQRKAPFGANREKIDHPSPRPLETVIYVIELFTNQGDTVLDPFVGSGTTGIACIKTGRNFIGIEKIPEYYELAQRRIKEAQMQPRLL